MKALMVCYKITTNSVPQKKDSTVSELFHQSGKLQNSYSYTAQGSTD